MTVDLERPDRTVHAFDGHGAELVRYDRAGKWFVEHPAGSLIPCKRVTLGEAVSIANEWWTGDGSPVFDRPGGSTFDRKLRSHHAR